MEQYFTEQGKKYTEKVVALAAEVPEKRRSDFVIFLEGATAALKLQGIKNQEKQKNGER